MNDNNQIQWNDEQQKDEQQLTQSISSPSDPIKEVSNTVEPSTPVKSNNDIPSNRLKSPPSTPVPASILKSPSSKSGSHKKTKRKSTCSLSEDTGDEFSSALKRDKEPKKQIEQKKLSREERKMEAIVRAFEKMEKTEQRKNEQNKQKSGINTHSIAITLSNKKQRSSSSSHTKDKDEKSAFKKSHSQQGRRKRKRGKSYSQLNNQKRRRNRLDSNNSDATSDENSTPMMSPTSNIRGSHESNDKSDNLAAGLLLSLSSYGLTKNTDKNCTSPEHYNVGNKSTSHTPPFPVSSACLLIEAAVGPLDNDFKLPTKTKTKKTIMNEWLHQSDGSGNYSPHSQDRLLSPSTSMENYSTTTHNMSLAAQKIEEFINLTTNEQIDDDESSKWSESMTVTTPLPTPPLQMGSSVKKRKYTYYINLLEKMLMTNKMNEKIYIC